MNSPSPRAFELNLLSFLIENKIIFKEYNDSLNKYPFQWQYAKHIYDSLSHGVKNYNEIPNQSEVEENLKELANQKAFSNIEKSQLFDDAHLVFNTKTTGLTGEKVVGYLMNAELKRISEDVSQVTCSQDLRQIRNRIDRISGLSFDQDDLGLSVFSEAGIHSSISLINSIYENKTYPTGFPRLDAKLLGGLRPKEVSCLLAPTGRGKTVWLLNIAVNMVRAGFRVLYIALDNPINEIVERMLACVSQEPIEYGRIRDAVWVEKVKAGLGGGFNDRLFLKEYPPRQKTVLDIGRYVKRLRDHLYDQDVKAGVAEEYCGRIDVLLIDYLEKLKSAEKSDAYRIELEINAEYMLQVAHENDLHCGTGTQANRQAMEGSETLLHHGQESIAKFNPMGVVLGLSQSPTEKNLGNPQFRLSDLKVRRPASGYSIPFIFDVSRQTITENPNAETEEGLGQVSYESAAKIMENAQKHRPQVFLNMNSPEAQ